jgi:hypothetical protein
MKFHKRPVVIEAVQWTGENHEECWHFCPPLLNERYVDGRLTISTLEGKMVALPGDWIIRGVKGEFYPCRPDIFAATYEPV